MRCRRCCENPGQRRAKKWSRFFGPVKEQNGVERNEEGSERASKLSREKSPSAKARSAMEEETDRQRGEATLKLQHGRLARAQTTGFNVGHVHISVTQRRPATAQPSFLVDDEDAQARTRANHTGSRCSSTYLPVLLHAACAAP